jgi:hypothetical protein
LAGRSSRELAVYVWLGDHVFGINITRHTDRVREMQERIVNDIQDRLQREFGKGRLAIDQF